jgi:hypothetical protein
MTTTTAAVVVRGQISHFSFFVLFPYIHRGLPIPIPIPHSPVPTIPFQQFVDILLKSELLEYSKNIVFGNSELI